MTEGAETRRRFPDHLLTVAMAVLAIVPFAPSLGGDFVYDDHALIQERPEIKTLRQLGALWSGEFWEGLQVVHFRYFRPLVSTSYAIDWALWGGHPFGFHLTNLLMHGAVTALLYVALCRWTARPYVAWLAALAWAWHPSKVEAVSWISGRTDIFCAFGLLLMCAGLSWRLRSRRPIGYALEGLGLVVALASKEHAVVAPAFAAVEIWAYLRPPLRVAPWPVLLGVTPHLAAVLAYLALRAVFYPIAPSDSASLPFLDARLYTLETLGEAAKAVFYPVDLSLLRAPIRLAAGAVVHDRTRLVTGALFAGTVAVALWRFRRSASPRWRWVGTLLAFAALAPVANATSPKMVFLFAERFLYLPLMGVALALVPAGAFRRWWALPWALLLGGCFAQTLRHTEDFLDDNALWRHELAVGPDQPLALRWAWEQKDQQRAHRDALSYALRGYRVAPTWSTPQPFRVEFAARAARSLEASTLDNDPETLQAVLRFDETLLRGVGVAELRRASVRVVVDASGATAQIFLQPSTKRAAQLDLWTSIVAARLDRCDAALDHLAAFRAANARSGDAERYFADRLQGVLIVARCGTLEAALADAERTLEPEQRATQQLVANLAWIRDTPVPGGDLPAAVHRARVRTLLLDRLGALRALQPFARELTVQREGAELYAFTAWAAGEGALARSALANVPPSEAETLLQTWSAELGR